MNEGNGNEIEMAAPPVAELRQSVARKAKDLATAALDLEQRALFDEIPFEEAFCLPAEEVKKRYTAENARQIEWRRHACVQLLARQCSAGDICIILKMNPRTVAAIAAQETQQIAVFSEHYSATLANSAMSDLALAHTKRDDASYKDLHIGAGIKMTHAMAFKMAGAGGADEAAAIDLETENPALIKAREFLKAKAESRNGKAEITTPSEVEA